MTPTRSMPTTNSSIVAEQPSPAQSEERQLCPLSFAQERLWFLNELRPGNPAYNISQGWRLRGAFDPVAFESALNDIVCRQESLRTTFARMEGKPVVIISAHIPRHFPVVDLTTEPDAEQALQERIRSAAHRRFDLEKGPLFRADLFRVAADEHVVLFTLHHIISDAASFEILRDEVAAAYEARSVGNAPQFPELSIQCLDYAHWQRENLTDALLQDQLTFWRDYLQGPLPILDLPHDKSPGADDSEGASVPFHLDRATVDGLRTLAKQEGGTLFTALLAGLSALLHRVTGQDDFIVGTPVSARDLPETRNLLGFLVETIPLRTRIDGNPEFLDHLRSVRDSAFAALAHNEVPFDEVVKALQPDRNVGSNPLFQVVLALHGGFREQWKLGNLDATLIDVATETAKFDLCVLLEECAEGIKGRLEFKTDRFEAGSARSFLRHLKLLLHAVAANPRLRLSDYDLLASDEREQVLVEWNRTTTSYEREAGVHQLFEAQARNRPAATALRAGTKTISYSELNERADRLAAQLRKRGVEPGTLVGVALERSPELIITLLAILKAGAAYVPLDRSYPAGRIGVMIEQAQLRLVISDAAFWSKAPIETTGSAGPTCISLEELAGQDDVDNLLDSPGSGEHLAYVMFTSGSTGIPKATAIPHRAIVRLVRNTNYARFNPDDVFLQLAPVSFDASTLEIWGPLLNGGTLVLFPPHTPTLDELGRCIEENGVTTLWLTAGLFHQMVDHQLHRLRGVRQLLAGGDVLSVPHVLKALNGLPNCQLINGYGPTENTTFTCCFRIPRDWSGGRSVPIGTPISNTRVYVLDHNLKPVPVGTPGELFAAGDGLATGYLGQPQLTNDKFISCTIHGRSERLYRTGDRVRWLSQGTLEFLGRGDQQVKIRGFRIEPAEIEATLARHPGIRQAVVVARTTPANDRQLVAYVTPNEQTAFNEQQLRDFVASSLPSYMVPSRIHQLPGLPLTPNGKVDLRALPDSTDSDISAVVAPRDEMEQTLCGIWNDLLGRNGFGIHDNFFQLGGHSLLITQMLSRIARVFNKELPVRVVFETPTIAGLADQLREASTIPAAVSGIAPRKRARSEAQQLLTRIDALSDAEVESILSHSK